MSLIGFFIFILALATGCGFLIAQDPGYALFAYQDWTLEMPLWLSFALMIASIVFFCSFFWLIHWIQSSTQKIKQWIHMHQQHSARVQTNKGLLALSAGRIQEAERLLSQSAAHHDNALVNYLYAAQAAQLLGALDRRDHYLDCAFKIKAQSPIAFELTQATLNLKAGRIQEEVSHLQTLHQEYPKNTEILRLLAETYQNNQDFKSLFALLPLLAKQSVFSKQAFAQLEYQTYAALLPIYAAEDLNRLTLFWDKAPKQIQQHPRLIERCAELLIQGEASVVAEKLLRHTLHKQWDQGLIRLYGLIHGPHVKDQLRFIEGLLKEYPTDPMLLLSAGRICVYNQQPEQARDYFEKSLHLKPMAETYAAIGQLMEQLALPNPQQYFKQGLLLATRELKTDDI